MSRSPHMGCRVSRGFRASRFRGHGNHGASAPRVVLRSWTLPLSASGAVSTSLGYVLGLHSMSKELLNDGFILSSKLSACA